MDVFLNRKTFYFSFSVAFQAGKNISQKVCFFQINESSTELMTKLSHVGVTHFSDIKMSVEDTWRQPTEAESKVIAARQERSDKVLKCQLG